MMISSRLPHMKLESLLDSLVAGEVMANFMHYGPLGPA